MDSTTDFTTTISTTTDFTTTNSITTDSTTTDSTTTDSTTTDSTPTPRQQAFFNYDHSSLGQQSVARHLQGRLPSDADQSFRFRSARVYNNLPYSMHIFVDNILVIEVYSCKTVIQYKDASGTPKTLDGVYTHDGKFIRVDAVDDPCFWFSCKI